MDAHHEINRRSTTVKRIIILALGVLLALALATPMALAQVVHAPSPKASGPTAALAAAWTQWAYSKPVDEDSPLIGSYDDTDRCDGTPVSPTQDETWFLAGTTNGETVVRTCTMPADTQLFFPVVSSLAFPFFTGENRKNQRELAIAFIDAVENDPDFSMSVTVDGTEVESDQIVRATSPVFTLTLPEENVFDCPQCDPPFDVPGDEYKHASADGLWVTLPPLPPGEHEIHFVIDAPNLDLDPNTPGPEGFSQDNTYILTVS
jgi:hypothetical protein